jgi:glycosyltransferase involved in cell wall biosynthesis
MTILHKEINSTKTASGMTVLVLSRYGPLGASSRLRSMQFLPYLSEAGIECTVQPLFNDTLLASKYQRGKYSLVPLIGAYSRRVVQMVKRHRFDLLWIEKEALPWLPAWVERTLLGGVPYVLDFDDALFHRYDLHSLLLVQHLLGQRLDAMMAGARLVVGGNDYLAQRARSAGAPWVEVLPTVIDLDRYAHQPTFNPESEVPRIVWIGTPTTVHYLKLIHKALLCLRKRCMFKLRLIGARLELPGIDVEYVDWSEATEVSSIDFCQVGVMPLPDLPWERGKCGYKLVQYMACGLPVVASPVGVNPVIVRSGVNGYLADSDEEWTASLETLLRNASLRQLMGSEGRQRVEKEYSVQQVAPRLAQLLRLAARV